jgi:hypothetical protein
MSDNTKFNPTVTPSMPTGRPGRNDTYAGVSPTPNYNQQLQFQTQPQSVQNKINNYIKINPGLENDPNALHQLSTQIGYSDKQIQALVHWAAANKPIDAMHWVGNFLGHAGSGIAGAAIGLARIPGDYIYHNARAAAGYISGNTKMQQEQVDPITYALRTVGDIATSIPHAIGATISDWQQHGTGAGLGDISGIAAQVLLTHKLAGSLGEYIPKTEGVNSFYTKAQQFVKDYSDKISRGETPKRYETEKLYNAQRYIKFVEDAKAFIDEHPRMEKLGQGIGAVLKTPRIGLQALNKITQAPEMTAALYGANESMRTFNPKLWADTANGDVVDQYGNRQTQTEYIRNALGMQNSLFFKEGQFGVGPVQFKGGLLEAYEYLFMNDPFAAIGKLRRIAKSEYGFSGKMKRYFQGIGVRKPGDARIAYNQLGSVKRTVDYIATVDNAGKLAADFGNQFQKPMYDALAKANTPDAVLAIFDNIAFAEHFTTHKMPMMGSYTLWQKSLDGELGQKLGIVGNVFDRTYTANVYKELKKRGFDVAPDSVLDAELAVGDRVSIAWRKTLAQQFRSRAYYYNKAMKAMTNARLAPNDVGTLGYIDAAMGALNFDSEARLATLDLLYHSTNTEQWTNAIDNILKQAILRPSMTVIPTGDLERITNAIDQALEDRITNFRGANGGNTQGVYNMGADNLGVMTSFGTVKQVATLDKHLGSIVFPEYRKINAAARSVAKWVAQINGSPLDEAFKKNAFDAKANNQVIADLANATVKDISWKVGEHWSAVDEGLVTIYEDASMKAAYVSRMEEVINAIHDFGKSPAASAMNEAQRYAEVMDMLSREVVKTGTLKLTIDKAIKDRRSIIADTAEKYANHLENNYVRGEELTTKDLVKLQDLLIAENHAVRFVLNQYADKVTEQFDSMSNLRKMAEQSNKISGIDETARKILNKEFVDHWETARIGKVYFLRELRKLVPATLKIAGQAQSMQSAENAGIKIRASLQDWKERFRREHPKKGLKDKELQADTDLMNSLDEFLAGITDPKVLTRYEKLMARLEALGTIGRNMPEELLLDANRLEEFINIAEQSPQAAVNLIKKERKSPNRMGVSVKRNFRSNREIATDMINTAINTPFKAFALFSVAWSTHVSMSEFMLNSFRVGGQNFFNGRFAFAASRWEYRFGKMANGEKALLANSLGVLFHGMKKEMLHGMSEAEKDLLMEDAFWLHMNNDGHFPMGVHGHAGNVDSEGTTEMAMQKVYGLDKDDAPSAKRVFVNPDWTQLNAMDDGYASAWMDFLKLHGTDKVGSVINQIMYKHVMQEGAMIIARDERTFGDKILQAAAHLARKGDKGWMFDAADKEMAKIIDELAARDDFKELSLAERNSIVDSLKASLLHSPEQIASEMMTEAGRTRYLEATDFIREKNHALDVMTQQADIDLYNLKKVIPEVAPFTVRGQRKGEFAKLAMKMFGRNVETGEIVRALESNVQNPMIKAARRVMRFEKANKELEEANKILESARTIREDHPYRAFSDVLKKENRTDFIRDIHKSMTEQLTKLRNNSTQVIKDMGKNLQSKKIVEDRAMIDRVDPAIYSAHDALVKGEGRTGSWQQDILDNLNDTKYKDWSMKARQSTESLVKEREKIAKTILDRIKREYTFSGVLNDQDLIRRLGYHLSGSPRKAENVLKKIVADIKSQSTIPLIEKWAIQTKRIRKGSWDRMTPDARRRLIAEYGEIVETHDSIRMVTEKALGHLGDEGRTTLAKFQKVFETLAQHKAGGKRMADAMDLANTIPSSRRWSTLLKWRDVNLDVVLNADGLPEEQWMAKLQNHFENRYVGYKSPLFNAKMGDKFKPYTADEKGLRRFMGDLARYGYKDTPWRDRFIKNSDVQVVAPSQYEKWFKAEIIKEAKIAERRRLEQSFADADEAYHQAREVAASARQRMNVLIKEMGEQADPTELINSEALAKYREAFVKYNASARARDDLAEQMRRARESRDRVQRETFDRYNAQVKSQIEETDKEFERITQRSPESVLEEARIRAERLGKQEDRVIGEWSSEVKFNFEHVPELPKLDPETMLNSAVDIGGSFNNGFVKFTFPDGTEGVLKFPVGEPGIIGDLDVKKLIENAKANGLDVTVRDIMETRWFEDNLLGVPKEFSPIQLAQTAELSTSVAKALDAPIGENVPVYFKTKNGTNDAAIAMNWKSEKLGWEPLNGVGTFQMDDNGFLEVALHNHLTAIQGREESILLTQEAWENLMPETLDKLARFQINDLLTLQYDRHGDNILVDENMPTEFQGIDNELSFRIGFGFANNPELAINHAIEKITKQLTNMQPEVPGEFLFSAQQIINMDNELKDLYKYGKLDQAFQRDFLKFVLEEIWNPAVKALAKDANFVQYAGLRRVEMLESIVAGDFPRPVEQYKPMRNIPSLREAIMTDLQEKEFFDKLGRNEFGRSPLKGHRTATMQALMSMYGDKVNLKNEMLSNAQDEAVKQLALTIGAKRFSGAEGRAELHKRVWAEAHAHFLTMKKQDRMEFERSHSPLVDEKIASPDGDPIKDWATASTISALNAHYSSVNDVLHPEILEQSGTADFKSNQWMSQFVSKQVKDAGHGAVPINVPARQTSGMFSKATFMNLIPMVSNWGHAKILGPIVNEAVRSPLFLTEFHRQMQYLKPMIDGGFIEEEVARQRAETLAAINMNRFVHEPLGKTVWEQNMRVLAPFYFAKNQAIRRAIRMGADNLEAVDHYLRLNLFFTDFIASAIGPDGSTGIAIPGSQMLGAITTGMLQMTGAITGLNQMPGEALHMGFNGSPGSVNSMIITGNEAGYVPMLENLIRVPWGPVVVLPAKFYYEYVSHHAESVKHVMEAILGKDAMHTSFMSDLMPNTAVRNVISLGRGIVGTPTGSYLSMENQIALTVSGEAWLKYYEEVVQENPYSSSAIQRYLTDQKWCVWMKAHEAEFKHHVNFATALSFGFKTLIGEVSPLSTSFNNTWSESKIYNEMANERLPNGELKYPDINSLFVAFVTKYPGHVFDIVSKTSSPKGVWPETQATLDLIDRAQVKVMEVGTGAAYTIPRTRGSAYSASALSALLGVGLRQHKSPQEFIDRMMIMIGDDVYYNILEPEFRQQYPDGQGGISVQGRKILDNQMNAMQTMNPTWYDNHFNSTRGDLAFRAYTDMKKMTSNSRYTELFQSADQRKKFSMFVAARKEWEQHYTSANPLLEAYWKGQWYDITTKWYEDPALSDYQPFVSLMRKLPLPQK